MQSLLLVNLNGRNVVLPTPRISKTYLLPKPLLLQLLLDAVSIRVLLCQLKAFLQFLFLLQQVGIVRLFDSLVDQVMLWDVPEV